jgi:hypothetical protein
MRTKTAGIVVAATVTTLILVTAHRGDTQSLA